MERGESSNFVPESVMESVKRTLVNLERVETQLLELLSIADNPDDAFAEIPPLERAQTLFLLAKATCTLFSCMCLTIPLICPSTPSVR
uniref:Nuclear nucleic acid-binding protein C1D-like n=1 Tax=Rhizophora mucronata TaxID=61149 RepID=A0A2P2KSW4_RHIMU